MIQRLLSNAPYFHDSLKAAAALLLKWYDKNIKYYGNDHDRGVSQVILKELFLENPYEIMDPYDILKKFNYEIDLFAEEKISEFGGQVKHETGEKLIFVNEDDMDQEIITLENKNEDNGEKILAILEESKNEVIVNQLEELLAHLKANNINVVERRLENIETSIRNILKQLKPPKKQQF
jgi:hypothetical protein